jgi:hypothetical protein
VKRTGKASTTIRAVRLDILEIDDPHLRAADRPFGSAVLDGDAVDQEPMKRAVPAHQFRAFGSQEFPHGVLQRLRRQVGIEPGQRIAQAPFQDDLPIVVDVGHGCSLRQLPGFPGRAPESR